MRRVVVSVGPALTYDAVGAAELAALIAWMPVVFLAAVIQPDLGWLQDMWRGRRARDRRQFDSLRLIADSK